MTTAFYRYDVDLRPRREGVQQPLPCDITVSNTFGDLIHFNGGEAGTFSGTIAPSGPTIVGQFIHLKAKARATLGTQPTTTGYSSIGASMIEQQPLLITNGLSVPGTATTVSGGLVI
ncbi:MULTISPECIES: hypothetical protein [unclassified Bradyrhizobium]|uniref:hypothetical protein n=1 Tax=unclassified Bradyrhizobium TaxID=2631580 RepID=UPI0028EC4B9D|nr:MULTISPECIES: hypothetical protein [unclassified Bradyrhizobium]